MAIVALFILSWILRLPDYSYAPNLLPFVLGLIGVGLALATAWLGGELVFRHRVGSTTSPRSTLRARSLP